MPAMKKYIIQIALVLLLSPPSWAQEFAYVTDSLQLRVYAGPNAESEVLQTIESGDSVEVFASEGGFSQVTTYDDTKGWVKSAFLVTDPPAKLLYYSVSEQNKKLEEEIDTIKNSQQNIASISNEKNSPQVEELQEALANAQETNHSLQQQLAENESRQSNQTTTNPINDPANKLSMINVMSTKSILITLAAALIFGLLVGLKLSSMRMKKRFHGYSL